MITKNQVCCFTGHRIIPTNEYLGIQKRLEEEIVNLIHQGTTEFMVGGALGFDTIVALAVMNLKEIYSHIKLILVLPCKEQTRGWNKFDIEVYDTLLTQADKVVYTSKSYYPGCMHVRNRYLVDNSGCCICYLTKNNGGTKYTVDYAMKKGLKIIMLP